jgi:alpha-glucosidase (family GH31 glycosyl hydrolase)
VNSGYFVPNEGNGAPLYGLGERAGRTKLKDQDNFVHTLWPYDAPNPIDDGKPPGKNMYGYHPVYYYQANTSDWMAVFDVGTYASDYFVNTNAYMANDRATQITKIAVGGMIHKIFLQGKTIEESILKYQRVTGFQAVPPMWAFGWNQCKFGYYNSEIWWDAYQQYKNFSIPLDTMWGDIDYMDDYKVFTYSKQTYADLPQKVAQIRAEGR